MAQWALEFSDTAESDLAKLDRPIRRRILEKLEWFSAHFDAVIPQTLGGTFSDLYKLRVGDWRILYTANVTTFTIVVRLIDRRDKIYKQRLPLTK